MTESFYVEPEGLSGPELWRDIKSLLEPALVLRKADLPGPYDELLWRVVTAVLAPDDATVRHVQRAIYEARTGEPFYLEYDGAGRAGALREARAVLAALADPADTGGAA